MTSVDGSEGGAREEQPSIEDRLEKNESGGGDG